ncbi:hypothetical protein [Streptomyces sp. NBC_00690]|uniref:hypothetical protein n=1 Tax=Streptomyces sp. NBC_00690 TaxID=2975808 RepID=UPI002E2DDCEB|nr:hypothetical protein [Streptomyces sp. NBC_00690]
MARSVWLYSNRVRPALLEWSNPYDHLREVTHDDVHTYVRSLPGSASTATSKRP